MTFKEFCAEYVDTETGNWCSTSTPSVVYRALTEPVSQPKEQKRKLATMELSEKDGIDVARIAKETNAFEVDCDCEHCKYWRNYYTTEPPQPTKEKKVRVSVVTSNLTSILCDKCKKPLTEDNWVVGGNSETGEYAYHRECAVAPIEEIEELKVPLEKLGITDTKLWAMFTLFEQEHNELVKAVNQLRKEKNGRHN